jgi:hypothetical protein
MTLRNLVSILGLGALVGVTACGTQASVPPSQQVSAGVMSVNCGAGQQALIRPSTVNGQAVSQVECVPAAVAGPAAFAPELGPPPAAVVPVSYTAAAVYPARPVVARDYVEYRPRVIRHVRRGRSVKESAVIIGSSAGIGAAIGGAVKGGKGALIGAAIGGGGAALWDQATRHRR